MSYVSGSIPSGALPALYENAFRALRPGGMVVIHDFFVDNDGNGPTNADLWALAHVLVNPEGMGLVLRRIIKMLGEQGFIAPRVYDLIPGMTQESLPKSRLSHSKRELLLPNMIIGVNYSKVTKHRDPVSVAKYPLCHPADQTSYSLWIQ